MPTDSGGKNGSPAAVPRRSPVGERGKQGYIGEMGMILDKVRVPYDLSLEIVGHWQLMRQHEPEATISDAVRELVRLGVAAVPEEAVLIATRARAFGAMRSWIYRRVRIFLLELAADLEEVLHGSVDS